MSIPSPSHHAPGSFDTIIINMVLHQCFWSDQNPCLIDMVLHQCFVVTPKPHAQDVMGFNEFMVSFIAQALKFKLNTVYITEHACMRYSIKLSLSEFSLLQC